MISISMLYKRRMSCGNNNKNSNVKSLSTVLLKKMKNVIGHALLKIVCVKEQITKLS